MSRYRAVGLSRVEAQRYFLQNEQLIQKLSESPPIRRAAQLTAYMMHKSKEIGQDSYDKMKNSESLKNLMSDSKKQTGSTNTTNSFKDNFARELKEGLRDLNKKIKKP